MNFKKNIYISLKKKVSKKLMKIYSFKEKKKIEKNKKYKNYMKICIKKYDNKNNFMVSIFFYKNIETKKIYVKKKNVKKYLNFSKFYLYLNNKKIYKIIVNIFIYYFLFCGDIFYFKKFKKYLKIFLYNEKFYKFNESIKEKEMIMINKKKNIMK